MEVPVIVVISIIVVLGVGLIFAFCFRKYCYSRLKGEDAMALYSNRSRSSSASSVRKTSVQLAHLQSRSLYATKAAPVEVNNSDGMKMATKPPPLAENGYAINIDPSTTCSIVVKPSSLGIDLLPSVNEQTTSPPASTSACSPPAEVPYPPKNTSLYGPSITATVPQFSAKINSYLPESVVLINEAPVMAAFYPAHRLPPPTYSQAVYGRYSSTSPDSSKDEFTEYQSYR